MNRRNLVIVSVLLLTIATAAALLSYRALFSPIPALTATSAALKIEIVQGSSFSRVTAQLAEDGVLPNATLFKIWARLTGVEDSIQTGEYEFEPGLSAVELLDKIVRGESVQYRITLVEGWTFQQALDAIWQAESIEASVQDRTLGEIAQLMGLQQENPEGLLYPDTYFYTKGTTDLQLLNRANDRLELILDEAWESRLGALPYRDPYEALVMASIIEKESASSSERGIIAAVFVNRLDLGMRLQSDPTTIYGMGQRYSGNIRREDLSEETPYNTYRIDGLPPTPIALSGYASILAALNPSPSDYLYFVARRDGSHQFSRTLEEHNVAVREHQLSGSN